MSEVINMLTTPVIIHVDTLIAKIQKPPGK
jgi:hypothetical protein